MLMVVTALLSMTACNNGDSSTNSNSNQEKPEGITNDATRLGS